VVAGRQTQTQNERFNGNSGKQTIRKQHTLTKTVNRQGVTEKKELIEEHKLGNKQHWTEWTHIEVIMVTKKWREYKQRKAC